MVSPVAIQVGSELGTVQAHFLPSSASWFHSYLQDQDVLQCLSEAHWPVQVNYPAQSWLIWERMSGLDIWKAVREAGC